MKNKNVKVTHLLHIVLLQDPNTGAFYPQDPNMAYQDPNMAAQYGK